VGSATYLSVHEGRGLWSSASTSVYLSISPRFKLNSFNYRLSRGFYLLTCRSMKSFGNTIKLLLMDRGITAKEFAGRINLSETSLSKIVQGVSKPRQANLTRIIEELCETPEEQQQLIAAYARIQDALNDEAAQLHQAVYDRVEEDRVRSYLQAKSLSIAFRESVAAALTDAGIDFQGPHQNQDIICDFFMPGTPSIAIECKSNPSRDWDRTITSARLLRAELPCDQVVVVVPSLDAISKTDLKRVQAASVQIIPLSKLVALLQ
jgi:predicted transcriptional regulator